MTKTILGVDSGLTGALTFYDGTECLIFDMPVFQITTNGKKKNTVDCHRLLQIIREKKPDMAYLENVNAMPGQGVTSMFNMGRTLGRIEMAIMACDVPLVYIRPQEWKKYWSCPADKDGARQLAGQRFPQFKCNWELKKHHNRAESFLISVYGHHKETLSIGSGLNVIV